MRDDEGKGDAGEDYEHQLGKALRRVAEKHIHWPSDR